MDALQRIQDIFRRAEDELAELAAECVAKRHFDEATFAIDAARRLAASNDTAVAQSAAPTLSAPPEKLAAGSNSEGDSPNTSSLRTSRPRRGDFPRPRKGEYPKFVRENETLVKIGWSKSDKTEYEHKSPKSVLACLIPDLVKLGVAGKRFSMDKVFPLKNGDGSEIPGYQAYLCLAWLRSLGVVQQHGRQGYSIPRKVNLAAAVDAAWEKLSRR